MAHGQNAQKHQNRKELWSRRLRGMYDKTLWAKKLTHRLERRKADRELRKELRTEEYTS